MYTIEEILGIIATEAVEGQRAEREICYRHSEGDKNQELVRYTLRLVREANGHLDWKD